MWIVDNMWTVDNMWQSIVTVIVITNWPVLLVALHGIERN
jgi:hypothetical protein